MPQRPRAIPVFICGIIVSLLFCINTYALCEDEFEVKRIGNIHPYADNAFRIRTSEAGSLEIRIHDNICLYRTINADIPSGETTIHWDGCGYNREKLYEKTYTITAELTLKSGQIRKISFDSPVEYAAQCLQYALPSSDILYQNELKEWFLEFRTVTKGQIVIEISSAETRETLYSYSFASEGGKIARRNFTELAGKRKTPSPGNYILSVYEYSKPEERYEYSLKVAESAPMPSPISVTGEIMADRTMNDQEIWELMMKPSVVIDIDSFRHQEVYKEPDPKSVSLGTLHGQSQGLKVIRIENEWAFIGAWNHEEAAYVEGWVPVDKLKVEAPRGEYGILIDKQKQTMTVYRNGEVIDTLLVSTGRAEKNSLYQETSAGCFLTGYHRVNFSMNGKKYDYVIQYDGGNLLHQTPYDWGQHKKDFTLGRGYLGAKASHACIRIQPEPGEGGLNAYWLFTHLPYHTRVMILDDPWEHESRAQKLKRTAKADVDLSVLHIQDNFIPCSDDQIAITFGGSVIPGENKSFNNRNESFSVFIQKNGYDLPVKGLKEIFENDDLTCVYLGGNIMKNNQIIPEGKGTLFATAGTERIFDGSSVELVQMMNDKLLSAGESFWKETSKILEPYTDTLTPGHYAVYSLKGHKIGFTGCTESDYLSAPTIIDKRLKELKDSGCEKAVMLLSWSEGHDNDHSIVQEAMAHRSVRSGADLVIGSCQSIVQGIDYMEGVPVIYSLGDLINGSTSVKPKTQQGFLVRAIFSFADEDNDLVIAVIPIQPYGSGESGKNEYCPSADLSEQQFEKQIRNIWRDTTDSVMERIIFRKPAQ